VSIKGLSTLFLGACISMLMTGCGSDAPEVDSAMILQNAKSLMPADAELADVYGRSCISCHAVADTVAPLTGDRQSWEPRMAQGMDVLIDHVIDGYGGMPPLGLCMECEPEQFRALIEFMAQ